MSDCKHLTQIPEGSASCGPFVCPWCKIEKLETAVRNLSKHVMRTCESEGRFIVALWDARDGFNAIIPAGDTAGYISDSLKLSMESIVAREIQKIDELIHDWPSSDGR